MKDNRDFSERSGDKVDLMTVLRRRGRTVKDFLREAGIETLQEFRDHLRFLKEQYSVSKEFVKGAENFLSQKTKQIMKSLNRTTGDTDDETESESPRPQAKKRKTSKAK